MVDTQYLRAREMDLARPCAARVYDAFLGGSHNFGVEREFVERVEQTLPGIGSVFRENRAFVRRTVEHLINDGVYQFLDLGSGIPTIGYVHEVARRKVPDVRVLYVDNEPLTVAHSRPLLSDEPRVDIINADCRDPQSILQSPEAEALLDFNRPIGLLMSGLLHFLVDTDEARAMVGHYRDLLPPGSYLMISHLTDAMDGFAARALSALYDESSDPLVVRNTAWITDLFGDFDLIPPGTSYLTDWRPDPDGDFDRPRYRILYGGVARKPAP